MGRSQETNKKKEVRSNKQKKKKEKEKKKQARKEEGKKPNSLDDMIAYVNEDGSISSTPPDESEKEETNIEDIEISVPKKEDVEEPDPIRKGTVTFFNDSKGYGFIKDAETQESIFVHINSVEEEITEGNLVSFEVEQGKRGPNAVRVKIVR